MRKVSDSFLRPVIFDIGNCIDIVIRQRRKVGEDEEGKGIGKSRGRSRLKAGEQRKN